MTTANIAVVGTGQRGGALAKLVQSAECDATLYALCDVDAERISACQKEFALNPQKTLLDYRELLNDSDVDGVILATPDNTHREISIAFLECGKNLFLEKPMANTVEDCKEIARTAEASDGLLMIGYTLRYTPFYERVHEIVTSGELGQIVSIEAREHLDVAHGAAFMRRWHRKSPCSGHFILTKCSHDLDLLSWFADAKAVKVASFGGTNVLTVRDGCATHCSKCPDEIRETCSYVYGGEYVLETEGDRADPSRNDMDLCVYTCDKELVDNQCAIIEYENGVRATFNLQLFSPVDYRMVHISGEKGFLSGEFNCTTGSFVRVHSNVTGEITEHTFEDTGGGHGGGDLHIINSFVDSIRGGTSPLADLATGFESAVTALAIDESMNTGYVVTIFPESYLNF
ncbi:Gfo/Idh/MocA family protein [Candidatus Hydrogenedentota bacterium]